MDEGACLAHGDQLLEENPTAHVEIEDMVAEGDKVAVRMTMYMEGKPFANQIVIYRLRDGKIVEDWFCQTPLDET